MGVSCVRYLSWISVSGLRTLKTKKPKRPKNLSRGRWLKKGRQIFQEKKTHTVAAPCDTNPSDATVRGRPTSSSQHLGRNVVGRDNSPISSRHPARQQPLYPTLSPPCRSHERRADWPRRQADPVRGVQPRRRERWWCRGPSDRTSLTGNKES